MPYASYGIHILFDTLGNRNNKKKNNKIKLPYTESLVHFFRHNYLQTVFTSPLNNGFVHQFIFHGYHFTVSTKRIIKVYSILYIYIIQYTG